MVQANIGEQTIRILRAYEAHSSFSKILFRETDEIRLLEQICQALVTTSNYRMAWVGYAMHDAQKSVKSVAQAGFDHSYLKSAQISWAATARGQGPTGRAIRTQKPCAANNIQTDPNYAIWRDEALNRGYCSSAAIPLIKDNQFFGVLNLYAPEPNAFDAEELRILGELADFVAYGIASIRAELEKKRLLSSLEYRAAELETTIDNIIDGVFVCDAEGVITLVNQAGLTMLNVSTIQEAQKLLWTIESGFYPSKPQTVAPQNKPSLFDRALRGEKIHNYDETIVLPGQSRTMYIRSSAAPIRNSSQKIVGAIKVSRDITDLIEFEKKKDDFIRVAAHELKTPLAVIKGYTQILLRDPSIIAENIRTILKKIDQGVFRIDRIVCDLIDVSKTHPTSLKENQTTFDLSELVHECCIAWRHSKMKIQNQTMPPAMVTADRNRVVQAINNLIDNAIRYSPEKQTIEVYLTIRENNALVAVTDHGIGIPQAKQKYVFERFYRAHSGTPHDYGGLGTGLYLSREIIVANGGSLWFESTDGKGSTFYLSLPLTNTTQEPSS